MHDLDYILNYLVEEHPDFRKLHIPSDLPGRRRLMRSLMNRRPPLLIPTNFLEVQDEELQKQLLEKGVVNINEARVSPTDIRLRLWQGDITRLEADAIVNAANSQMLGCFVPLHNCIDNAIHSAAGIQLRLECNEIMKEQGYPEPSGSAKFTKGYNLPSKFIIHTVGPIIENGKVTKNDECLLASCYQSGLEMADKNKLRSIAFCCISTGEYGYPNEPAAEIAVRTVREYFDLCPETGIEVVVFNVFKDIDHTIYCKLLQFDRE